MKGLFLGEAKAMDGFLRDVSREDEERGEEDPCEEGSGEKSELEDEEGSWKSVGLDVGGREEG